MVDYKVPLPKYTNYYALNAFQDHIYAVKDKKLFRRSHEIRGNRLRRDVRENCVYHKDIWHNTVKCNDLRDEIERLI